jgi:hypothetical protein
MVSELWRFICDQNLIYVMDGRPSKLKQMTVLQAPNTVHTFSISSDFTDI